MSRPGASGALGRVHLCALGLLLAATSARAERETTAPDPARAEFEAVCQRLTQGDNDYFGQAGIAPLEARLAAAEATGSGASPATRVRLRAWLAGEQMRLGDHARALALFEAARVEAAAELGDDWPLWPQLLTSLALVHLQLAEDENCHADPATGDPGSDRCILPLTPAGVHRRAAHTRAAAKVLRTVLANDADDVQAAWLLNLATRLAGDATDALAPAWRLAPDAFGNAPFARWSDRGRGLGIDAFDHAGGAVMDDFDGDGHLDLVSSSWHPCEPLRAFRGDGQGAFTEVTAAWGLDAQLGALNIVHADHDGDGRIDLLVLRGAWLGKDGRIRNALLRNDLAASGRFIDVTARAGLAVPAYPTQTAAWADADLDGDLDLYIGNEAAESSTDPLAIAGLGGRTFPSQLLRNDGPDARGHWRFTDIARTARVTNDRFAKGVAWGDVDNDGDPDLYVSNLGPNRLYRNDGLDAAGQLRFTDTSATAGVEAPVAESFATWFFDVDNDGDLDLFVADYGSRVEQVFASYLGQTVTTGHPVLYRNDSADGSIRFTDVSTAWGLDRPRLPMGANFGDLDNDGWLDVYLGTGIPDVRALMPNVMYRNDAGRRFVEVTAAGFGHLQKGHGVAFGDIDRDGDQDIFQQLGGAYPFDAFGNVLYENPGTSGRWLTLRLRGADANAFGIGARIAVTVALVGGGERTIHRTVSSGGSFGGSSLQQEIGLGQAERIISLSVRWPRAASAFVVRDVALDRVYEVREKPPALVPAEAPPVPLRDRPASHLGSGPV